MDITEIDEKWIDIDRGSLSVLSPMTIIRVSNTGKYQKKDGTIGNLSLRRKISYNGKHLHCYKIIAEYFLVTVKRPEQICIDHITHNPTDYTVNDVRNLRWCTQKENCCFEEARNNNSESKSGEKSHFWKGDNVTSQRAYRRALELYKAGEITEEEFWPYRDAYARDRRQRRMAMKTSDPI